MMRLIDDFLNKLTMYRTVLYSLCLLVVITLTFTLTGTLDFEPFDLVGSLVIIISTGFVVNQLLGRVYKVPLNNGSALITELIIFFLITPVLNPERAVSLVLITAVAIASKFVINYHGKHIFNPAALAVWIVGLVGLTSASWWIGSSALWPFVLIFGLLIARKIRRLTVVFVFAIAALIGCILAALSSNQELTEAISHLITTSPLIFLGTVMLTEPATMPSIKKHQMVFAGMVGILFATHMNILGVHIFPETALLIGNIYAFAVSPKRRWSLTYKTRTKVTEELYDYEFNPDAPLQFLPGQYMEWTIEAPLLKQDDRGNRRTYTIASAPGEKTVHIGVRMPKNMSTYKTAWANFTAGDTVYAGQVAGSFVLPHDASEKLLLIAGGVGVTPYRSMIKHLIDTNDKRDIVLLYSAKSEEEFMFRQVFDEAQSVGAQVIYVADPSPLRDAVLQKHVPDISSRKAYISGPPLMVRHTKKILRNLGVPRRSIKTDFFSGY
jgi:ferredoxin-NADP reductase/Na+-transporting NADH:ubiquinone oxidoreductase subunit NqrB